MKVIRFTVLHFAELLRFLKPNKVFIVTNKWINLNWQWNSNKAMKVLKKHKRLFFTIILLLIILVLIPAYFRAYSVTGNSDAPAYYSGDQVIVNLCAYDIRLPYTDKIIVSTGDPTVGDYILFCHFDGTLMFKRIAAIPGNMIEMKDNRLIMDGKPLEYEKAGKKDFDKIADYPVLGTVIEYEKGDGPGIYITYTPGVNSISSFAKQTLPEDMHFVLGSNRDNSKDSRHFGFVHRNRVLGKVIGKF